LVSHSELEYPFRDRLKFAGPFYRQEIVEIYVKIDTRITCYSRKLIDDLCSAKDGRADNNSRCLCS
jgi:hypothetical protein